MINFMLTVLAEQFLENILKSTTSKSYIKSASNSIDLLFI